ncbi:hypothetical protein DOM22_07425 [Bdellovibrio sp. ZAP7]|uniref:L,D-transpeptidase family protein n=1 Tax=Bdellovibrio sp. ZAP7 TaxID=2231053 RepID=UPI00115804F7|nr:L,D-transpeptidase family protein [Bdellovibrio sp. ZAP7]QDK45005.1 hypothetical protein DOM22_07425 [Bdellovibrio sp. ZAP7]
MKFNLKVSIMNVLKGLFYGCALLTVAYITLELPLFNSIKLQLLGKSTVQKRVKEYGPKVSASLKPLFLAKRVAYPPKDITLLYIKAQKTLSIFSTDQDGNSKFIKSYPVYAASGKSGPKLQEGDNQVPEGIYGIESLNPNSAYHLALRINYPTDFDKQMAKEDGRKNLGSDIMIHGKSVSIGCIAIGDEAIEELFVLAAQSNYKNWKVILSPVDFRKVATAPEPKIFKPWVPKLYENISANSKNLPLN